MDAIYVQNTSEEDDCISDSDTDSLILLNNTLSEQTEPPEVSLYITTCNQLGVVPARRIIDGLKSEKMNLRYRHIGPEGAHALATALQINHMVKEIDLEENGLDGKACESICVVLQSNFTINSLSLANNRIDSIGAAAIGEMLKVNNALTQLNISGNQLRDSYAPSIALGLQTNVGLVSLDMSHNMFGSTAAKSLGNAIGKYKTLKWLNLSWNHFSRKDAVTLCKGLTKSVSLVYLDLSWNGIGFEGAVAVSVMLQRNSSLEQLIISNNNINWKGASVIAKGLRQNSNLQKLHIGHNPLTMAGCEDILAAINGANSQVVHIGFEHIPVNRRVIYLMQCVQKQRQFTLQHGGLLQSEDLFGQRDEMKYDPLQQLLKFMGDRGIRPVELFRIFDKDKDQRISRDQFVQGLRKIKAPLDNYDMQRVLNRLDPENAGRISYQRLVRGVKDQIRNKFEEEKLKKIENIKKAEEQRRIIGQSSEALPPISERSGHSIASGKQSLNQSHSRIMSRDRELLTPIMLSIQSPRGRALSVRSTSKLSITVTPHSIRSDSRRSNANKG